MVSHFHENYSQLSVRLCYRQYLFGTLILTANILFLAAIGPGIFILLASYSGCNRFAVVAMFTLGMGFMGTFYSGLKANTLDIAPNYAGVVMAVANGIGGLTGVVGPYIVGLLTPHVSSIWSTWLLIFRDQIIIFLFLFFSHC